MYVDYIGNSETPLVDADLAPFVDALNKIRDEFPKAGTHNCAKIDSQVVVSLHETLSKVANSEQLENEGLWLWLSNMDCNGYFCDFIDWRHKQAGKNGSQKTGVFPNLEKKLQ